MRMSKHGYPQQCPGPELGNRWSSRPELKYARAGSGGARCSILWTLVPSSRPATSRETLRAGCRSRASVQTPTANEYASSDACSLRCLTQVQQISPHSRKITYLGWRDDRSAGCGYTPAFSPCYILLTLRKCTPSQSDASKGVPWGPLEVGDTA